MHNFTQSKNKLFLGIISLLLIILGLIYYFYNTPKEQIVAATSFEECVSLGNPVLEIYPPQCIDKLGNSFTQYVGNVVEKMDKIILSNPTPNQTITSPLVVTGQARGNWFFEASFPISLTNWDGLIIAQGIAQAQGDWMTTEFVPFTATLNFTVDPEVYSKRGTLILQKDNPSGLPEYDDALEIPVMFK